jgi:hypothetical protein
VHGKDELGHQMKNLGAKKLQNLKQQRLPRCKKHGIYEYHKGLTHEMNEFNKVQTNC